MKKIFTILLLLPAVYSFAQEQITLVQPQNNSTQTNSLKKLSIKKNIDDMPVVGNNFKLTYTYNNGKGFDVYVAEPDNMPVLKPDVVNESSLGVNKNLEATRRLFDPSNNKLNYYRFKLNPTLPAPPSDKKNPNF
ncbi:MAG: hypothetical protein JSR12_06150 [Bacteroidetes bacterium]|nr:hypothetical protein [Bacteroidota bacterium]